jgi:hypothetical protein
MLAYIIIVVLLVFAGKYFYERHTGKLTEGRSRFYKEKIFGIHPLLLGAFLLLFGGLWVVGVLVS